MMTWSEIQEAKYEFMRTIGTYEPGMKIDLPEWFKGVGIGFDIGKNEYLLRVNVRNDADVGLAEAAIERMGYTGGYEIHAVGDIIAL